MVKNLRMLRENMGLSQEKLASLTGLTARRVFSYERESNEPDIETLALLADFFGVTIDFLVGHTEDENECGPNSSLNLTRFGVRIRQFRESKDMERPELAKRVGRIKLKPLFVYRKASGVKSKGLSVDFRLLNISHGSHIQGKAKYVSLPFRNR